VRLSRLIAEVILAVTVTDQRNSRLGIDEERMRRWGLPDRTAFRPHHVALDGLLTAGNTEFTENYTEVTESPQKSKSFFSTASRFCLGNYSTAEDFA
jgi:hypothetical protein